MSKTTNNTIIFQNSSDITKELYQNIQINYMDLNALYPNEKQNYKNSYIIAVVNILSCKIWNKKSKDIRYQKLKRLILKSKGKT